MWKTDFYSSQWISRTSYQASFFSRWKIKTFNHLPQICVEIFRFISFQNLCEIFLMFPLIVLYWWSIFPAINNLGTVNHCWMSLYCRFDSHDFSPFLESINCWNIIFKYSLQTLFYLDFYNTATSKQVLGIKKSLWTLYRLFKSILQTIIRTTFWQNWRSN